MHAIAKLLAASVLLSATSSVFAAATPMTYTVDNLGDAGMGSLRQAVLDANGNVGSDTIVFAPGLTGTIPLTSGEIPITDSVAIDGPGARVLSVDSTARIFNIVGMPNDIEVSIAGLTLTGGVAPLFGNGGGIIVSNARVGLFDLAMTGNAATTGEGGALSCTTGSLNIRGSTFSGNNAQKAGGLHLVLCSIDDMVNSTVSGNMASDSVGGIKLEFVGATIRNSTIAGNTAVNSQGGILLNQGNVLNLESTIVADNSDSGGGSDLVRFGANATINAEFSLIETPPAPNTINGTDLNNLIGVDPLLRPLGNNGGQTDTQSLPATSPAIDTGINTINLQTDQRGGTFARTIGGGTDIGAFERQPTPQAPVMAPLGLAALGLALLGLGVWRGRF